MISDKLHDAWFKEPLRVFAATSVNLEPVMRAIYSQAQAININTDQQKLVRLLENAAAAIEYFPRDRYKLNRIGVDPQELRDSILGVGNQAASLISGWLQQGEERSYMLYHNSLNEWLQRKQQTQIQLLDPLFDSRRDRVQATWTALKDMEGSISQRKDFTLESEKSRAAEDQARAAVERIHFDVSNVISSTSWSNIIAEDATLVSAKLQGIAVLSKIPAQLSSGSPGIIEAIKDDIKPNINFLNSLERQASLLAQLRSGAGDYRTQIAASLSLVTNCSNCNLGDLEKELHLRDQAISLILLRVDDFQVWEKSVGVNDLRAKLVLRDRQRTAKRQETLNTLLKVCVFSVFGGALVVFLCHLWRRYGEQKGYSELHSLPYTYDAVSRFLADSVYPQNVNDEVVDLIERCIYDELRNESPEKRVDAVRIWLEKLAKLQRQFATKGRNSADKVAKRLLQTMEGLNKTRS
jgi:hypothetical protein